MQSQCRTVDTLTACREVVSRLEREGVLAVDSEGVHLSRTGPLTLLQVATSSGQVYLFDILREPLMIKDGGLKRLLENGSIVKVLHSAKNDAEALYWQHGIELRNVHDTQVAHREIKKAEGQRFPPRAKLSDVCAIYCPEKTSLLNIDKDVVGTKMDRTEGEYWAKRPLTQEMTSYAASDVITLIPEMYTAQKKLLEEKGLMQTFRSRVERELRAEIDPLEMQSLQKEERDVIAATLREFAGKTPPRVRFQDITDENVVEALTIIRLNEVTEMNLPSIIRDLKLQQMKAKMEEVEHDMQQKGKDFNAHTVCKRLHAYASALDGYPLKDQAQRVLTRVNKAVLEDIRNKYTSATPLKHLAPYEKSILSRELRPRGEHDPTLHPLLLKLYWQVRIENLQSDIAKFRNDPVHFQVSEGYGKLLRFYMSGDVPARLKGLGSEFLKVLQDMGKISRPPQASGAFRGLGSARQGRRY